MQNKNVKQAWAEYCERELAGVSPILAEFGFALDREQPHLGGERYLMSGKKLVLVGMRISDNKRVIIKVSSDKNGMREIDRERNARTILHRLPFAYRTFFSPEELFYTRRGGYCISITSYIEQKRSFLARPIEEQFSLILETFKAQEGVHATTYAHAAIIRNVFGIWDADKYLRSFISFRTETLMYEPKNRQLAEVFDRAREFLAQHAKTIEQYCGFLTHEDFALQNLRIAEKNIYLIDNASLRFGNKYESWARFLNFMLLYNRPLEQALIQYVHDNRSEEEILSLRLMRIYKIGELLHYHARAYANSDEQLKTLSKKRIEFWIQALESLLVDSPLSEEIIDEYKCLRDSLRSEEEKARQRVLQQL